MMNLTHYYRKNHKMFERYFEALDEILPINVYLDYDTDEGGNFGDIEEELSNYGLNASPAQGATRLVIMPEELDVVIKIGAAGVLCCNYTEDEDEEYESKEDWRGCRSANYCEDEINAYREIKHNYSAALPFFLPILTIVHGTHTYYIQQRIDTTYNNTEYADDEELVKLYKMREPSYKSKDVVRHKMTNSRYDEIRLAPRWLAAGYEMYGADALNALCSYLIKTESGISANADFHYSNFGYVDGRPVIFDYAGFHEDF